MTAETEGKELHHLQAVVEAADTFDKLKGADRWKLDERAFTSLAGMRGARLSDAVNAIVAQQLAAYEMNCDLPWGKPLSKYGLVGIARVFTNHDPSGFC